VAELQKLRPYCRLRVGSVENSLRSAPECFFHRGPDADSYLPPVSEGNDYACTDGDSFGESWLDCVGKGLEQRERQRDLDETACQVIHAASGREARLSCA